MNKTFRAVLRYIYTQVPLKIIASLDALNQTTQIMSKRTAFVVCGRFLCLALICRKFTLEFNPVFFVIAAEQIFIK